MTKSGEEEHTWVYIGEGKWWDPYFTWTKDGSQCIFAVAVEECRNHPGVLQLKSNVFTIQPMVHCENEEKVYVGDYSILNTDGYQIYLAQLCSENGFSSYNNYGRLANNEVVMPSSNFAVSSGDSWYQVKNDRSCKIILPEGYAPGMSANQPSGVYFGITAFNHKPEIMPMKLLTLQNKKEYKDFVNSRTDDSYTYLYYSAEQAVNALKKGIYPDDLSSVTLITFTDGNDDGSLEEVPKDWDDMRYQSYVEKLISEAKINGLGIDAYSIGLRGNDVYDSNYELFKANLRALATEDKEEHATEVEDMDQVEKTLNHILDNLERSWLNKRVKCSINMRSTGDRIAFTLDKSREELNFNPENAGIWIEGIFSREDNSLNEVVYHGCTSTSGSKVISKEVTDDNGRTKHQFVFENMKDLEGELLQTGEIHFWHATNSNPVWVPHTEFGKGAGAETETDRESAAIMFVMDCSSSLGSDFDELKRVVNSLIDRIVPDSTDSAVVEASNDYDGPKEYFTLQGIKVTNPSTGIYIVKKGNKVRKVMFGR